MQRGVRVVLATVWLAACVVGTVSYHPSRLTLDQYSPLAPQPRQHGVYRRAEGQLDWKDQNPAENQPFDLSIGPPRSISATATATGSQGQPDGKKKEEESDSLLRRSRNSAGGNFSPLLGDKQPGNFVGGELTEEKADSGDTKGLESASRELSPPSELEDPFVADDTFQDQGPGSVEIYKLDLLREKSLLSPTPVTRFPSKSKAPKKTSHASWKFKPSDYDKATSLKMLRKQSNSFDDSSTEVPPNTDPFSIGGVPELQVGCEGLEASDHGKQRRSIDPPARDKNPEQLVPWTDVTPVSLDLDYDLSGEEGYEEMDELLKLKKSQTTTERIKQNRGDMDATLYSNFHQDKTHDEKLPVRGDLGKSSARNSTGALQDNPRTEQPLHLYKRSLGDYVASASRANQRRRILWLEDRNGMEEGRAKRDTWGFGENEGAVSSDELQTRNHRRRLDYERWRKEQERKRQQVEEERRREDAQRRNQSNSEIERIREEYEKSLELRQREEEERVRRLQWSNRWQQPEEQRRRSQQDEDSRRNRWLEEQRRRQESESGASSKRYGSPPRGLENEAERQRLRDEEIRMREQIRAREDERRRRAQAEAEARWREQMRRAEETRRREELDRRNLEERRREWTAKQRQQEEDERRRQQQQQQSRNPPSNLSYPPRGSPNGSRWQEAEIERERQRKLDAYMQRHVPINLNDSTVRRREEAERRKLEEERRLQEYLRRTQRPDQSYEANTVGYRGADEARQYNRPRYPGPGSGRRNHGPSASTNIDPRSYEQEAAKRRIEEERRREREQQLRREALRREEEVRRAQSRRYEEERRRQEAARLEEERLAAQQREEEARRARPSENARPSYHDRRPFDQRRRPDTGLIPANLFLNESRRAKEVERQRQDYERQRQEHERQRQEHERRRQEYERQREEYERMKQEHERRRLEAERRNQPRTRPQEVRRPGVGRKPMTEEERRREEARLNALSVKARIIVGPPVPNVISRTGFENGIDFQGANPYLPGPVVPNFPAPPTKKPPRRSLPPCIWAVVNCCPSNINRLVNCFEAMGCPGVNWEPEPCRDTIVEAAKKQVVKYYKEEEEDEDY